MRTAVGLSFALCALFGAPVSGFGGAGIRALHTLLSEADLVVVGVALPGGVSGTVARFRVDVERALKGEVGAGTLLDVVAEVPAGTSQGRSPQRGLFFLRRGTGGGYLLVPAVSGSPGNVEFFYHLLPREARAVESAESASVQERVFLELLAAFEKGGMLPGGGLSILMEQRELAASPAVRASFARYRASAEPRLRALGLCAGVANGEEAVLRTLTAALRELPAKWQSAVLAELSGTYRSQVPGAVAALGALAAGPSTEPELRKAAARALARVHTRESIRYLAPLLDSPELDLRISAVGGISAFVNNGPGTSSQAVVRLPYRTEETARYCGMGPAVAEQNGPYVNFWRQWWREHESEFGSRR
jgi:hypothetical protein